MKGVILGIAPGTTLVDITHAIAPQDVLGGALQLAAAFSYFPADTIFLAVVDPGVGSARRALAARAGAYTFVAPDNGLLTAVFDEIAPSAIVELASAAHRLPTVSRTFEGRDRFAPAAAHLARGTPLSELGPPVRDPVRLAVPRPVTTAAGVDGEVLYADRFGNLVTNVPQAALDGPLTISAGSLAAIPLAASYADMRDGEVSAIFGSTGHLELSVKGGSAAARLGQGRGLPVSVRRTL